MPVYEYRCPDCARIFEKLGSFANSEDGADCPACGTRAGKLLSTFAAIGGRAGGSDAAPGPVRAGGGAGGGCCGGGCCGG